MKFQLLIRRCFQNKTYFLISMGGLALSLTIVLLTYSFIVKEVQMDRFHKNGDDIYLVVTQNAPSDPFMPISCAPLASESQNRVPGIKTLAKMFIRDLSIKLSQAEQFGQQEACIITDPSFFTMFTFPLTNGTITPQSPKGWAVISQSAATRYFGKENPIGQNISTKDHFFTYALGQEFQIVAVMQDFPDCSTLQADIILDYQQIGDFSHWRNNSILHTYLQLEKGAQPEEVAKGIGKIFTENMGSNGQVALQPLKDIYFNQMGIGNCLHQKAMPQGSILFTRILCGIALLILFLSISNYLMIKMAQSQRNQGNYAIQRCFGANNGTIRRQTLQEILFLFLGAGILAVILTVWLFPTFREIISPRHTFSFPLNVGSIGLFVLIVGAIILIIGHVLSQYSIHKLNIQGIQGSIRPHKSTFDLKQVLMIVQIIIFCALLTCTGIVGKQISLLKNKDMGYDTQNLMSVVCWKPKDQVLKSPDIISVSTGFLLPQAGSIVFNSYLFEDRQTIDAAMICGDADYLDTYKISLLEGENFNKDVAPRRSSPYPVIVNQEFVRRAGLKNPLGSMFLADKDHEDVFQIIGIMKDFNLSTFYHPIPPLILSYSTGASTGYSNTSNMVFRYKENKRAEAIEYLQKMGFNSFGKEYDYAALYEKEETFARSINIGTCIAIFIGGLGIFAFSVFMVTNRKKEVALRKINGATEKDIHWLLHRQFVRSTLYACAIAMPLSYYFMNLWLEKFAYRTSWDWWFFLMIIASSLLFVTVVICSQVQKAVRLNPVECLHEN